MNKVIAATTGVITSALVGVGAYSAEIISDRAERKEVAECMMNFEDDEQIACIEDVRATYDKSSGLQIIQLAGLVGIVGCGYLGYKATKEEVGTTGILEDHVS